MIPTVRLSPLTLLCLILSCSALLTSCSQSSSSSWVTGPAGLSDVEVVGTTPRDGAIDVPRDALVSIEFSRAMRASSFTSSSFRVESDGEAIDGRLAASSRFASFRAKEPLKEGSRIAVILTTDLRDADDRALRGEIRFEFETAPKPKFGLTRVFPRTGQGNVPVISSIEAEFNETLDATSVGSSSIRLIGPDGNPRFGAISVNRDLIVFEPNAILEEEAGYRVTISDEIRSASGGTLDEPFELEFTTGRYIDVVSVFPPPNATEVSRNADITVELTENVDPTSIDATTFRVEDSLGVPVVGDRTVDGRRIRFEPIGRFEAETQHRVRLSGNIRSDIGTILGDPYEWTFTTDIVRVPPTVYAYVTVSGGDNLIIGYPLDEQGRLTGPGEVSESGGRGTSSLWISSLSGSVDDTLLFASNMGSDDISSLAIQDDGSLVPVPGSPFASFGDEPVCQGLSPDGRTLYIGCTGSRTISIMNIAADGSLSIRGGPVVLPGRPYDIVVSPDSRYVAVAFAGSPTYAQVMEVIADDQLTTVAVLPSGFAGATSIAFEPSQAHFFTADWGNSGVYAYETSSWTQVPGSPFDMPPAASSPVDGIFSPTGEYLYIVNRNAANVSGFAVGSTGELTNLPGSPYNAGGTNPNVVAGSRSGKLYVGNASSSWSITTYQIESNGRLTTIEASKKLPVTGSWLSGIVVVDP
ncbi:MAG: Ig-like domain-containing protein [Planctomycetota bacterium]